MSDLAPEADKLGHCRFCGAGVSDTSFRDHASQREYPITATCQSCQDDIFLGTTGDDPAASHPVRDGTVVAPLLEGRSVRAVALLPFRYVAELLRIAWEPRHLVLAGAGLAPVDPWAELGAMRDAWTEHRLHLASVPSPDDALVSGRLAGCDMVVGMDVPCVLAARALCPTLTARALVPLCAEVPWLDAYGAALLPLDRFPHARDLDAGVGSAGACRDSPLRQCALAARLLSLRATTGGHAGRTAWELLLLGRAGRGSSRPRSGAPPDDA